MAVNFQVHIYAYIPQLTTAQVRSNIPNSEIGGCSRVSGLRDADTGTQSLTLSADGRPKATQAIQKSRWFRVRTRSCASGSFRRHGGKLD
jgi:hypothetical protein